jgi:hypothetical protein
MTGAQLLLSRDCGRLLQGSGADKAANVTGTWHLAAQAEESGSLGLSHEILLMTCQVAGAPSAAVRSAAMSSLPMWSMACIAEELIA